MRSTLESELVFKECQEAFPLFLNDSEFFHKNRGSLFSVDNNFANERFNFNTRNNKDRIKLSDNLEDENILQLSDIADISELDSIFISNRPTSMLINSLTGILEQKIDRLLHHSPYTIGKNNGS